MFHIIGYIIFGFIVGLIARAVVPGRQHMSLVITSVLGVAGALLAGWLGRALKWYGPDDNAGFITSTAGAVLLLYGYHLFTRNKSSAGTWERLPKSGERPGEEREFSEISGNAERPDYPGSLRNADRSDRSDRPDRSDRSDRPDRPDRKNKDSPRRMG